MTVWPGVTTMRPVGRLGIMKSGDGADTPVLATSAMSVTSPGDTHRSGTDTLVGSPLRRSTTASEMRNRPSWLFTRSVIR